MHAMVDFGTPVAINWVKKGANMKTTEQKMGTTFSQSFKLLHILLTLFFIFILSGCSVRALEFAKRKASPSVTHKDWNLKKVRSAVEQENGDISVCVELYESHNRNKSECYAITMPNTSLLNETKDLATLGFIGENEVGHPPDPYITDYLYPLEKAKKGCQKLEPKKLPADSILPIVKLSLPENDRDQLYTVLNEIKVYGSPKEELFEVKLLKGEEDSSIEINESEAAKYSDVLLVYWPSGMDQEFVQPIGIGGGYESEDESTKLYYMLVPPAIAVDLFLVLMLVTASGGGGWSVN